MSLRYYFKGERKTENPEMIKIFQFYLKFQHFFTAKTLSRIKKGCDNGTFLASQA